MPSSPELPAEQNDPSTNPPQTAWERSVLEKLAFSALEEQKTRRKWGLFFKLFIAVYLVAVLMVVTDFGSGDEQLNGPHTAMVHLKGTLDEGTDASADNLIAALRASFADKNTKGVVLRINSPGGSPVQAGIVNDEIRRLRQLNPNIPIVAVVEDMCASGGYYVAAAADKIFVNKASLVGSIGVLMDGFGFTGVMQKLGVERRLLTAGENKGFLDPFSHQDKRQEEHAHFLLKEIHRQFIDVVRQGRGARLKETPEMFSGLVWTGTQSIELGLADALGTVDSVARDEFKADKIVDYSVKENIAERFAKRLGASVGFGLGASVRAFFSDQLR
jgi:protease IV